MRYRLLMLGGLLALFGGPAFSAKEADKEKNDDEYIKVEVRGMLRHGIVAIGGETTGTTITAKGITWELDLRKDPAFRKLAEKLDGKAALVTGTLQRRKGVEVPVRWIVTVNSLEPANGSRRT